MTNRFAAALLALTLSTPALAQQVMDSALSDLNGDGLRERFTVLQYPGAYTADLIIEDTGFGRVTARDIVNSLDSPGRAASVDVAPNGSIRLTSQNESIGRDRWRQTLTIAFRNGMYLVAGLTYDHYDTLDTANAGGCDLNLLNGKGFVYRGSAGKRAIAHDLSAVPLTDWKDTRPLPKACLP